MTNYTEHFPNPAAGQRRLFLKAGCPFCTKLVVFLAAAGLLDKVKPIYDCPPVREYISAVNNGKCSFPAIELEENKVVMLETADIIALLSEENAVDSSSLWAFRYFEEGLLVSYSALFGYLIKSEGGYPQAKQWFDDNADMISHPCPPEGAAEVL